MNLKRTILSIETVPHSFDILDEQLTQSKSCLKSVLNFGKYCISKTDDKNTDGNSKDIICKLRIGDHINTEKDESDTVIEQESSFLQG